MNQKEAKKRISTIVILHYVKLFFRVMLFSVAMASYVVEKVCGENSFFGSLDEKILFRSFVWLWFVAEMIFRIVPSKYGCKGYRKMFKRNYQGDRPREKKVKLGYKGVPAVLVIWGLSNVVVGTLKYTGIIDDGAVFLICLGYSVLDMACVLTYCPFREWFMKNKCCTTCRIYSWDYIMIFLPLIFVEDVFAWILLGFAALIFVQWEVNAFVHPERFTEETNKALTCENCEERLCIHKKQRFSRLKKKKYDCGHSNEKNI